MIATLQIAPVQTNTPLPMPLAVLADALNEAENIDVHAILPARGKIAFIIEKGVSNAEIIDTVCDAIAAVFDTDTVVSNERKQLYNLRYYARRRGYHFSKTERVVTVPDSNRRPKLEKKLAAWGFNIQLNLFGHE